MPFKKTPKQVMALWIALGKSQQNSKTAKELSAMVGMKSMAEVETAALFDTNGMGYDYEPEQWEYQYEVQHYTPDFRLANVYVEIKGKATKETRNKMLAVKAANPDKQIVIRFLKGNNKISAGSKTTYLKWFRKKGFVCFDWNEEKEFLEYIKQHALVKKPKGLKKL